MIECVEDNLILKKTNKKSKKPKKFFAFFLIAILLIGGFLYYKNVVVGEIFAICNDYCYSYATESVNDAVLESLTASVKYSDIVNIEKNLEGDIVLINADPYKINLISREITAVTQKKLKEKLENGIPIPFFAFSGIDIISGYGFNINYKSVSISSVNCSFSGEFNGMGINQTLHSIYAEVTCKINVNMPLVKTENVCKTQVLISESILVGKVPEFYLKGGILS